MLPDTRTLLSFTVKSRAHKTFQSATFCQLQKWCLTSSQHQLKWQVEEAAEAARAAEAEAEEAAEASLHLPPSQLQ